MRKLYALILAAAMLLSSMPFSALAEEPQIITDRQETEPAVIETAPEASADIPADDSEIPAALVEEAPAEELSEDAAESEELPAEEVTEPTMEIVTLIDESSSGVPENAAGEDISDVSGTCSGYCDADIYWTLDTDTGLLTIAGTGEMTAEYDQYGWRRCIDAITSVIISEGVTSIGENAFNNCRNLTSVTISDSVTSIGKGAFLCCSSLASVTIPLNVTYVGESAFCACSALSEITIPAGVTTIGTIAFYDCSGLTSITIADSLTRIENAAFGNCANLSNVYYGGSRSRRETGLAIGINNESLLNAAWHYGDTRLEDFVTRLYTICLGRAPGDAELSYYVSRLSDGAITGVIAASNFVFSSEFMAKNLCSDHYASYLYRVFFDRAPGEAELNYWADRMDSGLKREEVFNGFAMSSEYNALCRSYGITQGSAIAVPVSGSVPTGPCTVAGCGAVTTAPVATGVNGFVERLYSICLGRNAGADEVSYYANMLTSCQLTGTQAAWNFFSSPEYRNRSRTSRRYIIDLYNVLLGRDPAESEIIYHLERLSSGSYRAEIFNGFAMSAEFLSICDCYSITRGSAIAIPAAKYRALLVGNTYSTNADIATRYACGNDARTMAFMLGSMTATPYTCTTRIDLSASGIIGAIASAFADATEYDVSLFFYSGHGSSNGSIVGTDGYGVTPAQLKAELDRIPGRKIILLNSCYSGQSINKTTGEWEEPDVTDADAAGWCDTIMAVFDEGTRKSGELAAADYYVITSSSGNESSWVSTSYGIFPYCFEKVCGWNESTNSCISTMIADSNGDRKITLDEAFRATYTAVNRELSGTGYSQTTRVNPSGSSFMLFGRQE